MKQRGRRSAAADAVIVGGFGQRPDPPKDLSPRQAEIWRLTVASEDVEFFATEALRGLLVDYCRHRESCERLSFLIEHHDPEWMKSDGSAKLYERLLRMRDIESRASMVTARSLRLTNQTRYSKRSAAVAARNAPTGPRPWEK